MSGGRAAAHVLRWLVQARLVRGSVRTFGIDLGRPGSLRIDGRLFGCVFWALVLDGQPVTGYLTEAYGISGATTLAWACTDEASSSQLLRSAASHSRQRRPRYSGGNQGSPGPDGR